MSYIGKVDMNDANIKHYSLTGSTLTTVDIGWVPPSEQSLRVTINGVVQQGGTFSLSGSNLTLGGALVSTDNLEVVGIQSVGNLITPADNSVTAAKLADAAVTLAKMAGLARGKIIVGDASGDPSALTVGAANQVLKSDGTDVSWGTDVGGKILQIVQTVDTTNEETTTSTSFVTTNVSVTITPTSSSSDMLVMANGGTVKVPGNGGYCNTTIYRGVTDLSAGPNGMSVQGQAYSGLASGPSGFDFRRPESLCFLDTGRASGVGAVTYTIYFRVSSQTATYNDVDSPMTLTVMEIDA